MLLPFVVTAVAGPGEGAVFGICISLTQGLDLISAGMGVSLTVHAADRPDEARELALRVWRRVAMVVLVAALALAAASPLVLRIFGTAYVDRGGVTVITVLAATSVIRTGFIIWASLQRALRNTGLLLALNSVVAATMLPLVILLAHAFGAVGAASGVAVAQLLLSVFVFFHLKSTRSR
jgi:O-antigen/teichoic acid export membrane protein